MKIIYEMNPRWLDDKYTNPQLTLMLHSSRSAAKRSPPKAGKRGGSLRWISTPYGGDGNDAWTPHTIVLMQARG